MQLWQDMVMLPTEEMSMFMRQWKKELFTLPNLLSMIRLGMIPAYIIIYLNAREPRHFYTAGILLGVSCLTDALDGQIARRWNQITSLGKILDPLADKLTQFAVLLCLCIKYRGLRSLLVLFVIKELFQLTAGVIQLRRGKMLSGALMAGKISTTVLFASLILLILRPNASEKTVLLITLLDGFFLTVSFLCYLLAYLGKKEKFQDL